MADFWNILIFLLWWEKWTWFSGGGFGGVIRGKKRLFFTVYHVPSFTRKNNLFLLRFTSASGKPQLLIVKFDGRFLECINFSATMETL